MYQSIYISEQQKKGYRKTVRAGQSAGFMCRLVYFTVKICTILMLYNWRNILWDDIRLILLFILVLIINTYYMMTTGNNAGYEFRIITKQQQQILMRQYNRLNKIDEYNYIKQKQLINRQININNSCVPHCQQQQKLNNNQFINKQQICKQLQSDLLLTDIIQQKQLSTNIISITHNYSVKQLISRYCKICNCVKRNRMKHCYSCGKCVMKMDHHCPWVNGCVGQLNHAQFVISLFTHTIQAIFTFIISIKSLQYYNYYDQKTQIFSTQYGVFALWSVFMFIYIIFAGGLFGFHLYLISVNLTTRQLVSRRKCQYLSNIKGNPFNQGLINNLVYAINPDMKGKQWIVNINQLKQPKQPTWIYKIFNNSYYQCC